ncbi:MAG: restriction endonuclease subunit S, partial [Cytophagales bacterium]|nr:restriction endonuclease subunit S [Cytophagales bacterium]
MAICALSINFILHTAHFQAIQIPLAPLAEQKRIADKLDTV